VEWVIKRQTDKDHETDRHETDRLGQTDLDHETDRYETDRLGQTDVDDLDMLFRENEAWTAKVC
jgi:hypothetical protein